MSSKHRATINPVSLDRIIETFEFLSEWEERYQYLSELGNRLPPMAQSQKLEKNLVQGCMSKVWICVYCEAKNPSYLLFEADCDTSIIKGLVALLVALYWNKTPTEILDLDADALFARLGLFDHLSPTRHIGVYAMVEKIRDYARSHIENKSEELNGKKAAPAPPPTGASYEVAAA